MRGNLHMYRSTLVAAFAGLLATTYAFAADPAADQAMSAPAGVERASALDTSAYTSVQRVYFNNASATSYIRFANSSGQSTSFSVKVVGGESGTDYAPNKSLSITVPDKASLQRSIYDIRDGITALVCVVRSFETDAGVI